MEQKFEKYLNFNHIMIGKPVKWQAWKECIEYLVCEDLQKEFLKNAKLYGNYIFIEPKRHKQFKFTEYIFHNRELYNYFESVGITFNITHLNPKVQIDMFIDSVYKCEATHWSLGGAEYSMFINSFKYREAIIRGVDVDNLYKEMTKK